MCYQYVSLILNIVIYEVERAMTRPSEAFTGMVSGGKV